MSTAVTANFRPHAANGAAYFGAACDASCYSNDAFAYSLSGGFANTVSPMATGTAAASPKASVAANDGVNRDPSHTLLIVDAACELPKDWLSTNGVLVLPHRVIVDGETYIDSHGEKLALKLFRRLARSDVSSAHCEALSASETHDYLQVALSHGVKRAIVITSASSRSNIYANSLAVRHWVQTKDRELREKNPLAPFEMWVIDSQTMFTGQAVIVAEAVCQLNAGVTGAKLVAHLDAMRPQVHSFMVPSEQHGECARKPGSIGLSHGLNKALRGHSAIHTCGEKNEVCFEARQFDDVTKRVLETAIAKVREGLLVPHVCASYAGELTDIRSNTAFVALETACERRGVTLHLSTMSVAGGISAGAGALCIAFACRSLLP